MRAVSKVYFKPYPSLVTMPAHVTKRHYIHLNEFNVKLMFAYVLSAVYPFTVVVD